MSYTTSEVQQVWGRDGERWEVSEDEDGLDLVKIAYVDPNSASGNASFLIPREAAALLSGAIRRYLKNTEKSADKKPEASQGE